MSSDFFQLNLFERWQHPEGVRVELALDETGGGQQHVVVVEDDH
jgi:hypothetical protein